MAEGVAYAAETGFGNVIYDSDQRSPLLITELRNFWSYRALIRLLVTREVLVRYKRSLLGVWWTLLNPLLTMAVMWLIFSHLFRFQIGGRGVPYVLYLLAGVILLIFFQQSVEAVAASTVVNAEVLKKVYVPAEVFSLSAGIAGAVNLAFSIVPLLILQLILGVGIPWTALLAPLPVLALLCFVVGLGLAVASVAVRFHDVLDLNRVILMLIGYLTPTFYPIEIVPHALRRVIEFNPVFHDLLLFRNLIYGDSFSAWQNWVGAFASGLFFLALGVWLFARNWRTAAGMI